MFAHQASRSRGGEQTWECVSGIRELAGGPGSGVDSAPDLAIVCVPDRRPCLTRRGTTIARQAATT